jgi:two-component system OmpR family response regulator
MSVETSRVTGREPTYASNQCLGTRVLVARPTRVLVVDDNSSMRHMIVNYLEQENMRVITASQRQEVIRQLTASEPSVAILDLQLGQEDGLDLLREIRLRSDAPVIIITGHRRDEIDGVVGLELGADDYVTKPFGLRELLARIRAVLRGREAGRIAARQELEQGRCRFGGWQLDRRARRLTNASSATVALTKGEYALLTAFVDAPQRPHHTNRAWRRLRVRPSRRADLTRRQPATRQA